jgi:hypothetical protein
MLRGIQDDPENRRRMEAVYMKCQSKVSEMQRWQPELAEFREALVKGPGVYTRKVVSMVKCPPLPFFPEFGRNVSD